MIPRILIFATIFPHIKFNVFNLNFSYIFNLNFAHFNLKLTSFNLNFTYFGNYLEKCQVRIWKGYIHLLIDLLISNNFSSMTFYCATRILRVVGRQSIRQSTDFLN